MVRHILSVISFLAIYRYSCIQLILGQTARNCVPDPELNNRVLIVWVFLENYIQLLSGSPSVGGGGGGGQWEAT